MSNISISPYLAMVTPISYNTTLGIYNLAHVELHISKYQLVSWGETWTGATLVTYSHQGTWGGESKEWIELNDSYAPPRQSMVIGFLPNSTIIDGASVSAQSLTNTLATSLTLAILALTAFSLRSEDKGDYCKYQECRYNPEKPDQPKHRDKKYK